MITNDTGFLSLASLKNTLRIKESNAKHDSKLAEIITEANSEVQKRIKPFTDDEMIPRGSQFWDDTTYAAALYARYLWFEHNFQLEKSKSSLKHFEERIKSLTESMSVEPTSRTEPTIEVTDFAGERITPFSQIGYGGGHDDLFM